MGIGTTPLMAFLVTSGRPFLATRLSRLATLSPSLPRVSPRPHRSCMPRCLVSVPPTTQEASGAQDQPSQRNASGMFAEGSTFNELGASPDIVDSLARRSIATPTNVQAALVPLLLRGLSMQVDYAAQVRAADAAEANAAALAKDPGLLINEDDGVSAAQGSQVVDDAAIFKRPRPHTDDVEDVLMVGAETGSGKTLAYLLPYVEAVRLNEDVKLKAIVLVPSRELCWQVVGLLKSYFPDPPRHLVLAGGQPPDVADVKAVRVVIATPASLLNYFRFSEKPDTSDKLIVVDEADMLLSGSFLRDVERILDQPGMKPFATRKNGELRAINRNRLLFVGATYPHWTGEKVRSIITWMRRRYPAMKAVQTEDIHKRSVRLQSRWSKLQTEAERVDALIEILERETKPGDKVMVFTSRAETSQRVCETVVAKFGAERVGEKFGMAAELHKLVVADVRKENLEKFRDGQARLLFCTDLGARGLDLGDVTWVVEFEFSTNVVGYLHRIGRTARAGASGRTEHFYDDVSEPLAMAIRERAEKETTVVEGVFSRNRSFRRKFKKRVAAVTDMDAVVIDEVDAEEEERLRG